MNIVLGRETTWGIVANQLTVPLGMCANNPLYTVGRGLGDKVDGITYNNIRMRLEGELLDVLKRKIEPWK